MIHVCGNKTTTFVAHRVVHSSQSTAISLIIIGQQNPIANEHLLFIRTTNLSEVLYNSKRIKHLLNL